MQRRPERISSLNVERGLYVLRYVSAAGADHPTIFVRPSPGDEGGLTVIPFPGEPADRMTVPGSLMVILVPQAATMQITAQATSINGSLNAELRLDPLKPGALSDPAAVGEPVVSAPLPVAVPQRDPVPPRSEPVARLPPVRQPAATGAAETGVRIVAHLARRGDVTSSDGGWVGGPNAPAPIEGLAIECPATVGDVQVQVLLAGEARWSEWVANGAFGGSRGRATPLVGLRFRLLPAAGVEATMEGEALFLGSAVVRKEGRDLEFRSAAGSDPLLGVRLNVKREVSVPASEPSLVSTVPQGGRVRVFRASGRRSF